jgi:hypothetical protein
VAVVVVLVVVLLVEVQAQVNVRMRIASVTLNILFNLFNFIVPPLFLAKISLDSIRKYGS